MGAMDSAVSGHRPMAGFCERGAESSGSVYGSGEFLQKLDYCSTGMQLTIQIVFI
jgi:hypothetical protein